jgi:hypothetical protein
MFGVIAVSTVLFSCSKGSKSSPTIVTVSTLAGSGQASYQDGIGVAASFNNPSAVAVSSSGLLYVGDWYNNLIRTIDVSTATVSTFAGTGAQGFVNGSAATAEFWGTANIVFDKLGNLFVADEENNVIREVSVGGTVTTLAGSGAQGYQDGPAASAEFYHPEGMVFDANGDMYVVDGANEVIRKITMLTGMVSTYAGTGAFGYNDGPVASAIFASPYGITIDGSGNLYVADIANNRIRKITVSTGMVSTFAGSGAQGLINGPATSAAFYYPGACIFDPQGNMYISELRNNTIRKVTPAGIVSTYAGNGGQGATDGPDSVATFHQPLGLAIDAHGTLYVADEYNSLIREITVTH